MDRSGSQDPSASGPAAPRGSARRIQSRRPRSGGPLVAQGADTRRIGNLSVLLPPARPPASSLAACLHSVQQQWRQEGQIAALWQAWPAIAGSQLAPHCRPLQWQGDLLTVGAAPGPWLQALQYNRHQLLGALRGAGFTLRDLRFRQLHPSPLPPLGSALEEQAWALHPSRVDVHGLADCPTCARPAPAGEMARWGHCGFCRRQVLAQPAAPASAGLPSAATARNSAD